MKAVLKIESIGDNVYGQIELHRRFLSMGFGKKFADDFMGRMPKRYWVAEIERLDKRYGYKRRFLRFNHKDYDNANSVGSRGVMIHYVLESGKIYEVKEPKSWKRDIRYFCRVNDRGEIEEITTEEVDECLKRVSV